MGTLSAIRTALKDNLSALDGYSVFDYEPKTAPPWAIIVGWPDSYDPRATMAGDRDILVPVRVVIPWQDDNSSDDALETAMDAVVDAIESDRDLGGACDDLSCRSFTSIGARTMPNDTVVMTFTVPVEVLA